MKFHVFIHRINTNLQLIYCKKTLNHHMLFLGSAFCGVGVVVLYKDC